MTSNPAQSNAPPEDSWRIGAAYDPYVGRWSRLVALKFLDRLAVPSGSRWLDVGCPDGDISTLVREGAFLCLRKTYDRTVLQSWPLPPRDPKWPALGVAALCMAGTWWMCAKRYRRRISLTSVGAA